MNVLLLKLVVTPALIGAVSLAGRRWGPAVSGWLVGLPLTSGPVAFFLALGQGSSFAARASVGILAGTLSVGIFSLVYARLAFALKWWLTLSASWLVFLALTFGLQGVQLPALAMFVLVAVLLILVLLLLARLPRPAAPIVAAETPVWDIPARMLIATAFVLALTASAAALGPQLSGLLAPFPIYTTILAVFTHRIDGSAAAAQLLRGVVLGLFAFGSFFLVLALLLVPAGIAPSFVAASLIALGVQGTTFALLRRGRRQPVSGGASPAEVTIKD
jgi:hypothetical protein